MGDPRPIGVFDSGVGGLTVVRSILDALPQEPILYFADTARFPYGPRQQSEVQGFAVEIARHLVSQDAKLIVMACNTATAAAMDRVVEVVPVPVIGVIEPAVRSAIRATRNRRVGLIGTVGTVGSGAYQRTLAALDPAGTVEMVAQACPLFVDFVERGDTTSPELRTVAERYLTLLKVAGVDTLIMGCTHYPLLRGVLHHVMGPDVLLVSSADETAATVYETLVSGNLLRAEAGPPEHRFESSGDTSRFAALVTHFLSPEFHGLVPAGTAAGRSP